MQQLPSLERASLGGLIGAVVVVVVATLALALHPNDSPPQRRGHVCTLGRPACSGVDVLLTERQFGMARRVLLLQRQPECADAARRLELVYHVAMAPDSDAMEAFVAVQHAIAIDQRLFGGTLHQLVERRRAVAPAAARAYDAHGLDAWARQANVFAR